MNLFICSTIVVPTIHSIIVTWHGYHNAYERNYKGKSIITASWHPQVKICRASNAINKYQVHKIFHGFGNQGKQHFID
jgi:hypothetical protein